jgi:hypothetical protein
MCKNPGIMLILLFMICISLPFFIKYMEGMVGYDTKEIDALPKFIIPENELTIADDMYKEYTKTHTEDLSYNTLPLI